MADEKLIFEIGFDLDGAVQVAIKDGKKAITKIQKELGETPIQLDVDTKSLRAELKKLNDEWNKLSASQRAGVEGTKLREQYRALTLEANGYTSTLRSAVSAEDKATAAKQRATKATDRQTNAYKTQSTYLSRLVQRMVAYASVAQAFSFIRNIREVTAEFELQRVALGSIIGDLDKANTMFEQIKAAAVKSPFQIKELVTYTKQLAAYKIESDELFETTQKLADVSAGLGVGMERLVLAYGQIRATGYLRASEVRQLTEAGIPIVEELAKKMSDLRGETVSAAEVMGLISERAISFGMVKEVFDDMTSAGGMFYKMQEKQAETLAGQWSNLKDSISIMYDEIGNTESVNNSLKSMISLVKLLGENWRDVYSVLQSLSVAMGVYYATMKNAAVASKALTASEARLAALEMTREARMPRLIALMLGQNKAITVTIAMNKALVFAQKKALMATTALGRAFWSLTTAMLSNPYTAVLAALAGITLAIVKFTTQAVLADDAIKGINASLSEFERHSNATKDLMEQYTRLAGITNRTEKEQKAYQNTLNELGKMYPDAIEGMDKYGNVLALNVERLEEASAKQRQFNRDLAESQIQLAESLIPKLEEEIDDAKNALGKKFFSFWGNYSKEWKFGLFGGDKDQSELLSYIQSLREEVDKLKKSADDARNRLAGIVGSKKDNNLSDLFNTWQKDLETISEGKNARGEDIQIFDDETISQITKLTDATSRVAEQYKKLKEEKKQVDKAMRSEGAKADKETYAQLESRLGKINQGLQGLYAFLKKYGGLDLITEGDDKDNELARLQKELQLHEKIYAKYKEYRKYMSAEEAKAKVEGYFGDTIDALRFKPSFDKTGYQNVLGRYKSVVNALLAKAKDETEKASIKKFLLDIGFKIDDKDWQETKDNLEKNLKKLSDDISRTKTAKDFFDRMLGMTGDKQLSASLTLSVYGEGGDLGKKLAEQTIKEAELAFAGLDISKAIDKNTGSINYALLRTMLPALENISEKQAETAEKFVSNGEKANADWLIDLQKTYQKAFTFEERRTEVMKEEAQKRKEIEENVSLSSEQKKQYTEASNKREQERLTAINLEEFKEGEDYLKIFEDIERLSIPTIERLIAKLREFIATNKELSATDLKHLTEQINKLEDGLVKKDAWRGLLSGIKDLQKARKAIATTAKNTKEYADAMDDANKANVKIQNALGGLQNEFSQAEQLIESFADTLGIAQDSDFGVFLDSMATAIGGVSKALAFAQLAVQLFDGTIKSFLASNPIGWILLIVSAIISAVQAIMNARIKGIDEQISKLQDRLDQLEYSYERLQKAQEKAFGTDYIRNYEQRLANLQAQQEAYLKQAELERSKGKKADDDKIKEYEEAYRDATDNIKEMQSELSEYFLGDDITSAARNFANAWIEAYKEFGNTTQAMQDKFSEMIQNMITESFAAKVIQSALQPIFDSIDNMTKDGVLDVSEASEIASMTEAAVGNIDVGMTNLMNALSQAGISVRGMGSDLTGISKDIATASEQSILVLSAGINTQNFYISQVPTKLDTIIALMRGENAMQGSAITLQDLVTIQNQHLSYLPTIAQHTAETVAECKAIVAETRRTADALERVIKPRGTQATHTVNTSL